MLVREPTFNDLVYRCSARKGRPVNAVNTVAEEPDIAAAQPRGDPSRPAVEEFLRLGHYSSRCHLRDAIDAEFREVKQISRATRDVLRTVWCGEQSDVARGRNPADHRSKTQCEPDVAIGAVGDRVNPAEVVAKFGDNTVNSDSSDFAGGQFREPEIAVRTGDDVVGKRVGSRNREFRERVRDDVHAPDVISG